MAGQFAQGFTTLEQEITCDRLPLEGKVPTWLAGSLLRNGPAQFEVGQHKYRHWFDGLAMLHRFSFNNGEEIIMETLLIVIMLFIVLDMASLRWGFDSTDRISSPEWKRREEWSGIF